MGEATRRRSDRTGEPRLGREAWVCAALDLGTNNCRLLIAEPRGDTFRIIDSFSRIVRLGEGLTQTGRLSAAAMERALAALEICAGKIKRRGAARVRAVATQACRSAANGAAFIAEAGRRTGLRLDVISPREEARLSVAGCLNLLDPQAQAALVLDVGGGSTELSWVDLDGANADAVRRGPRRRARAGAWLSIPIGVVTLAERFPESELGAATAFAGMSDLIAGEIAAFTRAEAFRPRFRDGKAHLVGTSGAITSLAGLHLRLPRYDRSRVDGLWMSRTECEAVAGGLMGLSTAERAAQPCIGPDRADLVLAGAAILDAVQRIWPCDRVRVADRGLREGLLLSLMAPHRRSYRRRRAPQRPAAA